MLRKAWRSLLSWMLCAGAHDWRRYRYTLLRPDGAAIPRQTAVCQRCGLRAEGGWED